MPNEESKQVEPAGSRLEQVEDVPDKGKGKDKDNQPEVQSDDEAHDDDDHEVEETTVAGDASGATSSSKKKKSKRKKIKDAIAGKSNEPRNPMEGLTQEQLTEFLQLNPALAQELGVGGADGSSSNQAKMIEELKKLKLQDIMTGLASSGKNVKDMASYKFWKTQPVPKFGESSDKKVEEGPLQVLKVDDIPKDPAPLIEGFEWSTLDLTKEEEMTELFELLNGHYVEDNEAMFRFKYSKSILKWALLSPGWKKEWHRGVRATQSRKLVAFIAAIPVDIRVRKNILHASEVNFMVIHKKLRSKRLAPVLIKEITRLCNLQEVWQAIYTGGIVLPTPVSTCRYFHRALNWQKLYEVGFSPLPPNSKPQYQVRKYQLPDHTSTKGLREMQPKDVNAVRDLLQRYMARYDLSPEWTREEVEHWLLHKKDSEDDQVVWSYVVEDETKKITDYFSFYCLESSVINHPKHQVVRAAYLFYYATEVGLTTPVDKPVLKTRLNALMGDALILAKKYKFDVFNALSLMDNPLFLEQQKYGAGDGQLHYYLFNYRCNPIAGGVDKKNHLDEEGLSGVGFVML